LALAASGFVLAGLLVAGAKAQESRAFSSDFYSFIPAKPKAGLHTGEAVPQWQGQMQKAKKAYRDGNFEKARKHLEAALADGNSAAAWYLGHIWRLGLGVEANPAKAYQNYRRAIRSYQNADGQPGLLDISVDAIVRVADYCREGDEPAGIAADPQLAFELYNIAAGHGHPGAQFGLGTMYLRGLKVRKNTDQALRWLTLAARKRYPPAQALLGDLYWSGGVVPEDHARAIMWYVLAANSARPESHPQIFARLDVMMAEASEHERLSGQSRAQDWMERFPVEAASVTPASQ
jgi:TPR repeat protein